MFCKPACIRRIEVGILSAAVASFSFVAASIADDPADSEVESRPPVEAPVPASAKSATPSAAELAELVKALSSDSFAVRRDATQKLVEAGAAAVGPVAEAAEADDLELPLRCVSILKKIYDSDDADAKAAAKPALENLAKSENQFLAGRAADAVKPPADLNPRRNRAAGFGGRVRVQVGARPVLERRVDVTEDGKRIEINYKSGATSEITVKVTEKKDGKDKVTEYKADSTTDLSRKHPEAYKLYRKHSGKAQIFINGQQIARAGGFGAARARGTSVNTRTVNGRREIRVDEGDRQMQFTDQDGKEIKVRITETVDGKEKTTELEAKDLEDLKQKHPEAAKVFDRHANARNRAAARLGVNVPRAVNPFEQVRGDQERRKAAIKTLEKTQKRLEETTDRLKKLAEQGNANGLAELARTVEAAREELERVKKELAE